MNSSVQILSLVTLIIALAVVVTGCGTERKRSSDQEKAGLPNPASVYCEEQGGTVDIRTDADGGQIGMCIFADGSECEEWAFYRGTCEPGDATPVSSP